MPADSTRDEGTPYLRKQGSATQLMVDGKPFLVLGGELHNSSSSCLAYMEPIWQRMVDLNFNTVLAPVSWMQFEPEEGQFEFDLVDGLIEGARRHGLRLIFLWFGSWKNGMSSYIPEWVKSDYERFPRARVRHGRPVEVLSTLSKANSQADATAFAALMRRVKEVDGSDHTVIIIQVENEVGLLGDSRDRCREAEEAFAGPVPEAFVDYLVTNKEALLSHLRNAWEASDCETAGTWEALFGRGTHTDEIFMAWHYARYIDAVTAAGRAEHDIPMFVNAWLAEPPATPGYYPTGGPLPHVMDIWQAAGEHIDFLAPDIYSPRFQEWCRDYTQQGNPLFIPEMTREAVGARNVFYAIGQHEAMGTSPFAVDSIEGPATAPFSKSYAALRQMAPLILEHQGLGRTTGFLLDKDHPSASRELGGYNLDITLDAVFGYRAELGYGLIINTGPDEFFGVGSGFRVAFRPTTPGPRFAAIGAVDEGAFRDGQWVPGRQLNGDENDQGNRWRFRDREISIERCTVYRYE